MPDYNPLGNPHHSSNFLPASDWIEANWKTGFFSLCRMKDDGTVAEIANAIKQYYFLLFNFFVIHGAWLAD